MRLKLDEKLSPHLKSVLTGLHHDVMTAWRIVRPTDWLFPGKNPGEHISRGRVEQICKRASVAAGLNKRVTARSLRHAFATHLIGRCAEGTKLSASPSPDQA